MTIKQLLDGRMFIESLDALATPDTMALLRSSDISHMIWRGSWDPEFAAFAGNFGVTFQRGDGPSPTHLAPAQILLVG